MEREQLKKFVVADTATIRDAMRAIDANWHEVVVVQDANQRVLGVITDGDVRRGLLRGLSMDAPANEVMTKTFVRVSPETDRAAVLDMMKAKVIRQIPVIGADGTLKGIHFLEELIGAEAKPNIAVIMAGGQGTRLRPLTERCPKPMISVAGRPILERIVLHLVGHGIRKIFISVNYLAEIIESHFGDGAGFHCEIEYLRESEPRGTGGALAFLPGPLSHPVVVLNGDQITQVDFSSLLEFHRNERADATIAARSYQVEIPFGVLRAENRRLVELTEKPSAHFLINSGIYVLDPSVLPLVPRNRNFPITELFSVLLEKNRKVAVHYFDEEWIDVGRHEDLRKADGRT